MRTLSFGCSGVDGAQRDVRRALIPREDKPPSWIEASEVLSEDTSSVLVLLGGDHRSFLKLQPSLRTLRLIVATETLTP